MICPSCSEFFKNPKYLPCHHSYCEECLEKMQENSKIICLKCANTIDIPIGGIKNLPNNYFMNNLINQLILNYKLGNEKELNCEECDEDDPVVIYCTNCKRFLCCYCKESHKHSKIYRNHNLISLTEMRSKKDLIQLKCKFPTCQEHDLELEHYCESCEKLVCVQCTRQHEGHKCDVIKKFANKYHSELEGIGGFIDQMTENLSKLHDKIENVKTVIRQQGDKISKEIDLYYDEAIEKLLKQKQEVKQQVLTTVLHKEKAVMGQLEEVIHIQDNILNLKKIRDVIENRSSDQELLSASNQLLYSLEKVAVECDKMRYEPIESPNIKIVPASEPLPQVVKHFATIDSLSYEVKNFSGVVQQGQTNILEIITKDSKGNYYPRGGCKIVADVVEASTGEAFTAHVADNNDGSYIVYFAAPKVDRIDLSVFVNGCELTGSPFRIVMQENPRTSNKIITIHNDSFGQLWGLACGYNGTFAVADWLKNYVYLFDSQGNLTKKVGTQGSGYEEFKYPVDVAFDSNNDLYVVESQGHRVQKFNNYGDYLFCFGDQGTGEGQLNRTLRVTTHQNKVYVADRENKRISVFQNDGIFCAVIGQQQLSQYFDIAVNINSEILAADWQHHCIHIFALDGQYIGNITLHKRSGSHQELNTPCIITTDSNGFILIADTSNHCISIFDKHGNYLHCFGSDQVKYPRGIAVGPNGNLYVSDTGNRRIKKYPAAYI